MKKYILFTNTKEKYHKYSLELHDNSFLLEHLQKEFNFKEWYLEDVIKDFYEFLKDAGVREIEINDFSIKKYIFNYFDLINTYDFNADLFNEFCKGKVVLISTFYDIRSSYFMSINDMNDETDFFVMALNELLSKHGTTTSPVGVVNVYEIVAIDENVEGQEELELPF